MRMSLRSSGDVLVLLTEDEAKGVADALSSRLEDRVGFQGPGYHLHLETADGVELTLGVLDSPDEDSTRE